MARRGLPVALGIIYISAARTLGLQARGVNFPGHFLVRAAWRAVGHVGGILHDGISGAIDSVPSWAGRLIAERY